MDRDVEVKEWKAALGALLDEGVQKSDEWKPVIHDNDDVEKLHAALAGWAYMFGPTDIKGLLGAPILSCILDSAYAMGYEAGKRAGDLSVFEQ